MPASRAALADWHQRPGALHRLMPPWQDVEIEHDIGPLTLGAEPIIRVPVGPFRARFVAAIRELEPGHRFVDEQVSGPFGRWRHEHRFIDEGDGTRLRDNIEYAMPLAPLGDIAAGLIRRDLEQLFRFRHHRTAMDLRRHLEEGPGRSLTVVISGASGLIGQQLTAFLETGGHTVRRLVREPPERDAGEYRWDPKAGTLDPDALVGADAVVHLAGAPIAAKRWTEARKQVILDSRIQGTQTLAKAIAAMDEPPSVMVSASAVGYYGHREELVDESASAGDNFLAEVCTAWERSTAAARAAGVRVVRARIGVVLDPRGGALAKMLPAFRLGLGGPLGSGRQGMSWIGIDDLLAAFHRAIVDPSIAGPVNFCAPNPVSQRDFARALGRALRRPAFIPVPAFALEALFGDMARPVLLEGVFANPSVLLERGFAFECPEIDGCLSLLLRGEPPPVPAAFSSSSTRPTATG